MKITTIALASALALSSTFALAQTGSSGTSSGSTTGANTSGTANQGTGASSIQSDKMNRATNPSSGATVNNGITCDSSSVTNNGCGNTTATGR